MIDKGSSVEVQTVDEKVWPRVSRFKRVVEGEGESVDRKSVV